MANDVFHFCTYFDQRYLMRGLALIESLEAHCPQFEIWVLCLDDATCDLLTRLAWPGVHTIRVQEIERANPDLAAVKPHRTLLEYYFTCTPSLPRFVLDRHPGVDLITYLDADLFFFANPTPLFTEIGTGSIGLVRQDMADQDPVAIAQYGIYNVSWVTFRRDATGLACLHWWHERCIEWCFLRSEDGKFGEQKYLDDWPTRFAGVVVLTHKGANLAPWNVSNHSVTDGAGKGIMVDGQPLIYYHFSRLTQIHRYLYDPRFGDVHRPTKTLRRCVYGRYLQTIAHLDRQIKPALTAAALDDKSWVEMRRQGAYRGRRRSLFAILRCLLQLVKALVSCKFLISIRGRVI